MFVLPNNSWTELYKSCCGEAPEGRHTMRTVRTSLLCLLACSSLAALQHAAAVDTYERWEVESQPVAQLIDIMGRVEVDQDQIDLVRRRHFSRRSRRRLFRVVAG